MSWQRALYEHFFAPWGTPVNASLFFALAYLLVWLALMGILYRLGIFLRV
jgi:predicted acyltransferase